MSDAIQFFAYGHLPPHLQAMSKPFAEAAVELSELTIQRLASELAETLPDNGQADLALQKVSIAASLLTTRKQNGIIFDGNRELALQALIEAKDCAVRALLFKPGSFTIDGDGKAVLATRD